MVEISQLLSFCILTYKNFDGIIDTLDSLFQQDHPCIELIISDDGFTNYEEHIQEIKQYIKRYDVDIYTVGSDWAGKFDYLKEFCKVISLR